MRANQEAISKTEFLTTDKALTFNYSAFKAHVAAY